MVTFFLVYLVTLRSSVHFCIHRYRFFSLDLSGPNECADNVYGRNWTHNVLSSHARVHANVSKCNDALLLQLHRDRSPEFRWKNWQACNRNTTTLHVRVCVFVWCWKLVVCRYHIEHKKKEKHRTGKQVHLQLPFFLFCFCTILTRCSFIGCRH